MALRPLSKTNFVEHRQRCCIETWNCGRHWTQSNSNVSITLLTFCTFLCPACAPLCRNDDGQVTHETSQSQFQTFISPPSTTPSSTAPILALTDKDYLDNLQVSRPHCPSLNKLLSAPFPAKVATSQRLIFSEFSSENTTLTAALVDGSIMSFPLYSYEGPVTVRTSAKSCESLATWIFSTKTGHHHLPSFWSTDCPGQPRAITTRITTGLHFFKKNYSDGSTPPLPPASLIIQMNRMG